MPLVLFENWDEVTQRFTQIVEDVETGLPIITYTQNTKPILDQNKRDAANFKGTNPDGFTRVACIPNVVVQRLMQTGIWFDQQAMKQWLDDPENRFFRTDDGRKL